MAVLPQKNGTVLLIGFLAILGIVVWYFGRAWFDGRARDATTEEHQTETSGVDMTELKFLSPKEVLARLDRKEELLLIDIRPKESYDIEHVVDAVSMPVATLNIFTPGTSQLVIVIAGPEIPNEVLKSVHLLFTDRSFKFAFLQGSTTDWRLAGGTTLSSGDPESSIDYSKVIFIESTAVLPLTETLVSPLFLDVRSESLYRKSHLPGAVNIPLSELERRRSDIPRQKSIFVYGSNDFESYQGGVRLFDLGFFGTRAIRGGFTSWEENKLPIEIPEATPSAQAPARP